MSNLLLRSIEFSRQMKQNYLIKIHKFDSTFLKIDIGGSKSDKWWRLFHNLHPGFREAYPNTFIPGHVGRIAWRTTHTMKFSRKP